MGILQDGLNRKRQSCRWFGPKICVQLWFLTYSTETDLLTLNYSAKIRRIPGIPELFPSNNSLKLG